MVFIQGGKFSRLSISGKDSNMILKKRPIYAVYMDGIYSNYINVTNNSTLNPTANVISFFIKFTPKITYGNTITNARPGLFYKGNWTSYLLDIDDLYGNGNIRFNNNSGDVWGINNIWYADRTYVVIFTYDAVTAKIYIDGIVDSSTVINLSITDAGIDLEIGAWGGGSLNSVIHKAAIFKDVALTPTQVSNLSSGIQKPNDITGCVLYHDYTQGTARDYSGNGNDGTLKGTAKFVITDYETYYSHK